MCQSFSLINRNSLEKLQELVLLGIRPGLWGHQRGNTVDDLAILPSSSLAESQCCPGVCPSAVWLSGKWWAIEAIHGGTILLPVIVLEVGMWPCSIPKYITDILLGSFWERVLSSGKWGMDETLPLLLWDNVISAYDAGLWHHVAAWGRGGLWWQSWYPKGGRAEDGK